MRCLFLIYTLLICGIIFYSCESNDNPVINNPTPPVNVPENKVLVELFTNTSCIPCVDANQFLDAVNNLEGVTNNDTNVIIIRYHTTLFAGDPFYLYNTTDNNARMSYYPNSAIVNPRTFLLGIFMGNFASATWINKINQQLGEERSFGVGLTKSYDTVSRSGSINIAINQFSGGAYSDLVYHAALIENGIQSAAPNGETQFENTMRDLITPPDGQPFTINSGQTSNFSNSFNIPGEINQNKTDIIVFVQRVSTKEILGVEKIKVR
jgi:hypothetical protein